MNNTINKRIATYRKNIGLKQSQVAEKLGMKYSTYSQMERTGNISIEMAIKIAEILLIHPDLLIYGEQVEETQAEVNTLRQNINPFESGPLPTPVSGKEMKILNILRDLPKSDYNEVLNFINEKYQSNKN